MPVTHAKAKAIADSARDIANRLKGVYWDVEEFIAHNQAISIDWGAQTTPEGVNVDDKGNIKGVEFTPAELSNFIGSIAAFQALIADGHLGNLEKLADAHAPQS